MSLFDDASLVLTPNGYKASKLYSIKPTSGLGDMTVVRATTATRVNSAGLIESVAINVPRLDYTGGGCPKILVEPLRTNSLLYSNDLSQAVWSKTNYALTSATSIQGLTTTRITKNATSNGVYKNSQARTLNTIATFAAGTKTLTWLIRKGNTDKVGFLINNVLVGVLTSVSCEFDFTTQTFTNISLGLTASFENPTTDVYKIILTINDIGVSTSKAIWIAPIDNSNNTVTGGYLDFAFAQWEAGSNATSYIPTVAGTVTRNADGITKSGITSLIGQTEGTLFVDVIGTKDITSSNKYILQINGSKNIGILFTSSFINIISSPIDISVAFTPNVNYKIAVVYSNAVTNNFKVYVNGVNTHTLSTYTAGTFTALGVGQRTSGDIQVNSNINSVQLYQTALDNDQCIDLTN